MPDLHSEKILILDFGSQYTQLIARRVREANVYSEIQPFDISEDEIKTLNPKAIILSGGSESVVVQSYCKAPEIIFQMNIPVLGICYGMQTMAAQLGGKIESSSIREFGYAQVRAKGHTTLLKDIQDSSNDEGHGLLDVWMSHGDTVVELPEGFKLMASTENAPIAGMADEKRKFYGVQFHPEVTHTKQGAAIIKRFLYKITGCEPLWDIDNIAKDTINTLKKKVGKDKVLLGLSGGVDSSVTAALLDEAIGEQLICVFVDNGLLRLHEGDEVMKIFAKHMGIKVIRVDAEDRFLNALSGIFDPEEKRKIIGKTFIEVFNEEAEKFDGVKVVSSGNHIS